ncbi:tetratricopeptide repeat protein [Nonlabens antarcticus]|uniref:tetratricopeptide repeat protein n=1 Tax=Nonlabens antarcticus TaxID=392714 RepID=UPI001891BC92|nr:tetratricopeptide repeat protein [Nonlabens antarcticus]
MKKIIIAVALAVSTIGLAQKRELRKVEKAIENQDIKEATEEFNGINESEVEDKYMAEYKFYKAVILLGKADAPTAKKTQLRDIITMLDDSEKSGYDEKDNLAYYRKSAADAIFKEAQTDLEAGNQKAALESVLYLLEVYPENDKMRENAANLAYGNQDFKSAQENYEKLIAKGYTGSEESIIATEVKTGIVSVFPNQQSAKMAVLSGAYKDVKTESTASQLGSMVTNLAWIYKKNDEMDKANSLIMDSLKKYPEDISLKASTPDLYLMLGMKDKYEVAVKELNTEITDPQVFENLGVAASEKENWDQAITYYTKSLEIKSDNYVGQNNIAVAYINKGNLEETTVEDQAKFYTAATTHLEKVIELKPELDSAKQTLLGLYKFLDMSDKATALEAKM